ncbi:MAG: tRNA (adenosine(37)-N6)-threonylcarbamoyltransferase complex ATPase subunit type 1 TsaE [Ignavibacteria bacterium]|nr:tRNA (adenosine(37)-N6)-threonylcarbamoyltransferase complex ATPase subunit type 1 TsaE [Ignavibacteria bacterium]
MTIATSEYISSSENETKLIASDISQKLKPGDVIALVGQLGTGKTFLVKSLCEKWEISDVTSPTFSIVNQYSGKINVNHFDFYRIKNPEELYNIGFEEYLMSGNTITFIEWADMFPEILPKDIIKIIITYSENNKRKITIE